MTRNNMHGRKVDAELADNAEGMSPSTGRAQEWRDPEPPEYDEAGGEPIWGDRDASAPLGMTEADVEGRRRLARHLAASIFPADPEQIRRHAAESQAPADILVELAHLPEGEYHSVTHVWSALGHGVETGRS